jgi:hypothetical protein
MNMLGRLWLRNASQLARILIGIGLLSSYLVTHKVFWANGFFSVAENKWEEREAPF